MEVGCGSGFIGLFLLKHAPNLQTLAMLDINPHVVACAREALRDPRVQCLQTRGESWLENAKVDLLVCNPPNIPRPKSMAGNAHEGADLLAYFILHGAPCLLPGGRMFLNSSTLADRVLAPLSMLRQQSVVFCADLSEVEVAH
jgi:16S rRNA G1207 methylase RsmC